MRMAALIRQQAELLEVFHKQDSQDVIAGMKNYPELHKMFSHYLERYGDRTMGELKPAKIASSFSSRRLI